jgi:hypothetical protein
VRCANRCRIQESVCKVLWSPPSVLFGISLPRTFSVPGTPSPALLHQIMQSPADQHSPAVFEDTRLLIPGPIVCRQHILDLGFRYFR